MSKETLLKTQAASEDLAKMSVKRAPLEVKLEAEALEKKSNAAFARALTIYENATGGEEHEGEGDDSD